MSPVPIEEERFKAYLHRQECPGSVAHLPNGDTSIFIAITAPFAPVLFSYRILLPYHWKDAQRLHEVAMYIAYIELRHWKRSALDQIVSPREMLQADIVTVLELADRLIAPRPWVEDMTQQFGTSHNALRQAAQSLSIPLQSMRTVLTARDSQVADAVHRQLKQTIGYPWFLPVDLRDRYPKDYW